MNKILLLTGASAFALMLGVSAPVYADDGARASAKGTSSGNIAIDDGSLRDNLIKDTMKDFVGSATHQQNNGDANSMNVANAVAATSSSGNVDQKVRAETKSRGNETDDFKSDRSNLIDGALNDFEGMLTVQQNNGDSNAIRSAVLVIAKGISFDFNGSQ